MNTSRRKFISTLFLSSLSIPFINHLYSKNLNFNFQQLTTSNTEIDHKLKQAADARKSGNFTLAEKLYKNIILTVPEEIRAYDGLKKIILHFDNNNLTKVLDLYISGLKSNPDSAFFNERVGNTYKRILSGNKKLTRQIDQKEGDLSIKILEHYKKAYELAPDIPSISDQYSHIRKKVSQRSISTDIRNTENHKEIKRKRKAEYNSAFFNRNTETIKNNIQKLLNKENYLNKSKRQIFSYQKENKRSKQISKLYVEYIKRLKKEQQVDEAIKEAKNLCVFTQNSDHAVSLTKSLCKKAKKVEELEQIARASYSNKKDFWSGIGLFDALSAQYEKYKTGNLSEMNSILRTITPYANSPYPVFEIKRREIILSMYQNPQDTLSLLSSLADSMLGISSTHAIDRFNSLFTKYFCYIKQKEKALQVLDIALKNPTPADNDPIFEKIKLVNINRDDTKSIHKERLSSLKNTLLNTTI